VRFESESRHAEDFGDPFAVGAVLLLLPALPGMAQDMRRPAPPERPEVWFAPLGSVANYAQGGERDFMSLFSNQAA
jgi:hypothetical protein